MPNDTPGEYNGEKLPESRERQIESPREDTGRIEVGIKKSETEQKRPQEEAERGTPAEELTGVTERAPEFSPEQTEQRINEIIETFKGKGLELTLKAAGETGDLKILEGVITSLARNKDNRPEEIIEVANGLNDPYILDVVGDTLRYLENKNEQL